MEYKNIKTETLSPNIVQLTIDRESKLNALNSETIEEIISAFAQFKQDGTRVIIITGAGDRSFVAGADISEMHKANSEGVLEFARKGQQMIRDIELFPGIVIAAINGFALGGGCELSLGCDWMVGTENAKIGQPEVKIGVTPGFGGSQRLPRLIGKGHATKMIVDGLPITAQEAHRIGLLVKLFPDKETMLKDCLENARAILSNSFNAVSGSKQIIRRGLDMDLDNACQSEVDAFRLCFNHPDQSEGMGAFLEKRSANFE